MDKAGFIKALVNFVKTSPGNYLAEAIALKPELAGMQIYDEPLIGCAASDDFYFTEARKPEIIGPHFISPEEWLPGAKTVISIFLPFTVRVREANRQDMAWPADEWLHGRIEGHAFQNILCRFALELLEKEGFPSMAPMTDSRFKTGSPVIKDKTEQANYTSNWSERHAAYAAGLGTFGLSKGLISRKGVAGRYLSIITCLALEPDKRPYTGAYDYCTNCGACIRNCPAKAISKEHGKIHYPCSEFLDSVKAKHSPYYGCGKCQVKVPCESMAPGMK